MIIPMKDLTSHISEGLISSGGRAGSGQRLIDDATKGLIIDQLISQEMIMPTGPGVDFVEYEDTREWLESVSYVQGKTLVIDLSKADPGDVDGVNFTLNSANLPNIKILPSNDPDQSIFLLADIRLDRKICQWINKAFEKCPIWTIQADRGGKIVDLDIMTPEVSYILGGRHLMGYLEIKGLKLRHSKRLRLMRMEVLSDVPNGLELGALSPEGILNLGYVSNFVYHDVFEALAGTGDLVYVGSKIEADLRRYDIRYDRIFDKVSCSDDLGKALDKILVPESLGNVSEIEVSVRPHGDPNVVVSWGENHKYKVTGLALTRRNNEWIIRFLTR